MAPLVYHRHPVSDALVGTSIADESPLEPGVWLVPAHATLTAPPAAVPSEGKYFKWSAEQDAWTEADVVADEKLPDTPRNPLDLLRAQRNQILSSLDWVAIWYYTRGEPFPANWAAYFQALRDLPGNQTPTLDAEGNLDPASVVWPEQPPLPGSAAETPAP